MLAREPRVTFFGVSNDSVTYGASTHIVASDNVYARIVVANPDLQQRSQSFTFGVQSGESAPTCFTSADTTAVTTHPDLADCPAPPSRTYSAVNGTSISFSYGCRVHTPSPDSGYSVAATGTAFAAGVPSTLTLVAKNSLPETPAPAGLTSAGRRRLLQATPSAGNTINNTIIALNDATALPVVTFSWYDKGDLDGFR